MATTLSRMMNKVTSSFVNPLLACRRTPHRNYTSAIFTTPLKTSTPISHTGNSTTNLFRTTLIPTHHHFSAQATKTPKPQEDLFRAIKSEIGKVSKMPRDFPFKIEDNACQEDIILTREYQGEHIKVAVKGPLEHIKVAVKGPLDRTPNRAVKGPLDRTPYSNGFVYLTVSVSKNGEPTLEFGVIATPDNKMKFCYLNVKKPNAGDSTSKKKPNAGDLTSKTSPDFESSDKKLQKPFLKYLEVRGIKPSIGKFLNNYMANREYIGWAEELEEIQRKLSFA